MKNFSYILVFIIYSTILSGYFFNKGFKEGVLLEKQNTLIEFNKILKETESIVLQEKIEKDILLYEFNQSILHQESVCVDSINELESMLFELYVFSKAKEEFFNNFLEKSICLPKQAI